MKPPIIYLLSNRQRKDLLVRGTELQIALPVPPHEIDDPTDWAKSVIPSDLRDMVFGSAEETEVYVRALKKDLRDDLTSHFGEIYEEPDADSLMLTIVAVVITLRPPNCRHKFDKIQWPGKVDYRGEELPVKMAH